MSHSLSAVLPTRAKTTKTTPRALLVPSHFLSGVLATATTMTPRCGSVVTGERFLIEKKKPHKSGANL